MRECRSSGSVEGVISDGHSYSDSSRGSPISRSIIRVRTKIEPATPKVSAHRAASRALETSAPREALHQTRGGYGEDARASDNREAHPRYADAPLATRGSRRATAGMLAAQSS